MKTMNNMEKKDSPVGNREIQKHTTLQEHQKRQECISSGESSLEHGILLSQQDK